MAKTWHEKLNGSKPPFVDIIDKPFGGCPAGSRLLISSPLEIKAEIDQLGPGETLDPADLRTRLAERHDAHATCPLTTGIFLRIIAEAALVELAEGKNESEITPFWRVIGPKTPVAKKLTCGVEFIESRRKAEGIVDAKR
ncbi:MAG: hypothetical protein K1X67_12110 [Fimbriimonadaceae bacterium]|nr:hypothetical protein [Fimbriimonadaceae bacterium]